MRHDAENRKGVTFGSKVRVGRFADVAAWGRAPRGWSGNMVKIGLRKPNLKSSLKARTTGRAKRAVKRAIIPGYGKKGMGWIKNPKKAAYNAVYSRTTVGVGDVARAVSKSGGRRSASRTSSTTVSPHEVIPLVKSEQKSLVREITSVDRANKALLLCLLLGWSGAHRAYARMWGSFSLYLFTFGLFGFGWLFDIVTLLMRRSELRRLGDSDSTQQQAPCSVDSTFDRNVSDSGNWEQRGDEEAAARLELQRKNRAYMEENGIDVEMFTEEKVAADALRTIESVCPCMLRFDRGMSEEEPSISFCSPTKTGKMPKNVVEARIYHQDVKLLMDSHGFELPEYSDSINVMISYLADGRINKVDIHGFHNGSSVSVSIRRRSDGLVMTSAGIVGETGVWQSLCPGADPSAGDLFKALTKEVERIY